MYLNSYAYVKGQPGTLKYTTLAERVTYTNHPDDDYAAITGGQFNSVESFTLKITRLDRTEKMSPGSFRSREKTKRTTRSLS